MTLTTKDLIVGDCFRWIGPNAPDTKPTYADSYKNARQPKDMPAGWDACDVDDKDKNLKWWADHGDLPVEILEHYSRQRDPMVLTRGCIQIGECYMYCGDDAISDRKFIMVDDIDDHGYDLPDGWTAGNYHRTNNDNKRVRRIPRWDFTGKWCGLPRTDEPAKPTVVTPLKELLEKTCDGLSGAMCLQRLEYAMQHESLARPGGSVEVVSTLAPWGLNQTQVALGRQVWSAKLAELQAAARAKDAAAAVSVVTSYDPDDDIAPWPNTENESE